MPSISYYLDQIFLISRQDRITHGQKMYISRYIPVIKDDYKYNKNLLVTNNNKYKELEVDMCKLKCKYKELELEISKLKEENKIVNDLFEQELGERVEVDTKYNASREEIIKLQYELIDKKRKLEFIDNNISNKKRKLE